MTAGRLSVDAIKQQLIQRIRPLVETLCPGGRWRGGYWQGPNPTRAKDSKTSFTVWSIGAWKEYDADEKGDVIDLIAYCRRCTTGEAIVWAKDWLGLTRLDAGERAWLDRMAAERSAARRKAEAEDRAKRQRRAFDLWLSGERIADGGPVDSYLRHRLAGAALADIANREADLKQHRRLRYWGPRDDGADHVGPAMVAAIRQMDGTITGLHATFLLADGAAKAPLANPKLMLGTKQGGAVRLSRGASGLPFEDLAKAGLAEDLVVSEGIETGLAVALAVPEARVWAALDLGNIGALAPHPAIRRLVVCTERDTKPVAVEHRMRVLDGLEARGFEVVEMEPPAGKDFNDTLNW